MGTSSPRATAARHSSEHAGLIALVRRLAQPLAPQPVSPEAGGSARLGPLAGIRGVLFDVYGTLLISAAGEIGDGGSVVAKRAAMRAALDDAGLADDPRTPAAALVRDLEAAIRVAHATAIRNGVAYPEVDLRVIWRRLLPAASGTAAARAAVSYECRSNPVWPMPGAARVIAALQAHTPMGIVSNAQFFTPLVLAALLPQVSFDPKLVVWSFEQGEAKPSARLFAHAADCMARRHGHRPEQLLMVGNDVRNDILAARRAGLRGALFAGDARSLRLRRDDPTCAGLPPELVLTELAQLPAALEGCRTGAPAADSTGLRTVRRGWAKSGAAGDGFGALKAAPPPGRRPRARAEPGKGG